MPNQLFKFKQWLLERRRFRVAWFEKDPQLTPGPDEALSQLPSEVSNELLSALNDLPVHPREREHVLEVLDKAIQTWRKNPHLANNSVVILAHPVSSASRILVESLSDLRTDKEKPLSVRLLDWIERPPKPQRIQSRIKETFDIEEEKDRSEDEQKCLAVIPNLSWCFLRSADGLAGVDYLQDTLLKDRNRFWVIGSGQVGWEYLKSTLKLHAYCGEVIDLPDLTGEQLQSWLEPIIRRFNIRFSDAALHKRLENPESLLQMKVSLNKPVETISEITQEISATVASSVRAAKHEVLNDDEDSADLEPRKDYFKRLADISDGVSVVALQLFVRSLRYREITQEEKQKGSISQRMSSKDSSKDSEKACEKGDNNEQSKQTETEECDEKREIIAVIPKLPPLPDLSQSDMYLLYSLMLHGDLTIQALAESLGDAPQVVTNQVQMLRNVNVIEQKDGVIKTNPMHYPRLRRELAHNNFIIEVS